MSVILRKRRRLESLSEMERRAVRVAVRGGNSVRDVARAWDLSVATVEDITREDAPRRVCSRS